MKGLRSEKRKTTTTTALTDSDGIVSFPLADTLGVAQIKATRNYAFPTSRTLRLPHSGVVEIAIKKAYHANGVVFGLDGSRRRYPADVAQVSIVGLKANTVSTNQDGTFSLISPLPKVNLKAELGELVSSHPSSATDVYELRHGVENGPYALILQSKGDLLVTVLDKENMVPIPGTQVKIDIDNSLRSYTTDEEGFCSIDNK